MTDFEKVLYDQLSSINERLEQFHVIALELKELTLKQNNCQERCTKEISEIWIEIDDIKNKPNTNRKRWIEYGTIGALSISVFNFIMSWFKKANP